MTIKLFPCPFCEGPPALIVQNDSAIGGAAPVRGLYGDNGLDVRAFVFCHECGAEGPAYESTVYDRYDYTYAEEQAVQLWQARDARNRPLFDAGETNGLNLYPRATI